MNEPVTPMLEKEREARENGHSQEIGDFLEWLADTKGVVLARYDELTEHCRNCEHEDPHDTNADGRRGTGMDFTICQVEDCGCDWNYRGYPDRLFPIHEKHMGLLADYFGIDLAQSERERRALLDWVRSRNEAKS